MWAFVKNHEVTVVIQKNTIQELCLKLLPLIPVPQLDCSLNSRKIFWADRDSVDPKIEMANMDGSQRQVIVNSTWCGEPNHLYLDYVNNR